MDPFGVIFLAPGSASFDAWLHIIAAHPALEAMSPHMGINPFTREPFEFGRPYAALVRISGREVGSIIWEADQLLVFGEPAPMAAVISEIADRIGGRYAAC